MVTNRTVLPPEAAGRVVDDDQEILGTDDDDQVPEVLDDASDHDDATDASDDDNYLDFTLPSLDDHAARLREHPAWPWVCVDDEGTVVEVDYLGLSLG